MSFQSYTLDIISQHDSFKNKALRKYNVEGIETVGAWGNEPFEIRFKNNTWQKVQVKLTLDGTDILTGQPGDTEISKDMWIVNGYGTLTLKAWPEDNNGGAGFVFTSADNSVAVHTHGDMSSRGIIAAAVFVESHVEPIRLMNTPTIQHQHHHHHHGAYGRRKCSTNWNDYSIMGGNISNTGGTISGTSAGANLGGTYSSTNISDVSPAGVAFNANSISSNTLSEAPAAAGASFDSLVSVGAGQYVDQKITYVSGLIKPLFTETVRVKYLWWDDLKAKLNSSASQSKQQPSGFPGDDDRKNIDLKCTPRVGEKRGSFQRAEQMFDRF